MTGPKWQQTANLRWKSFYAY
ncbi:unnamed protein product [Larinioides sclopetarius]|uniref:Uncharacterized protein n=1 Tax=Larinioides sclopetarius TaxID=280406 RepID=A0AAV1ZVG4_9ARAC